jgi:hypothetical protein
MVTSRAAIRAQVFRLAVAVPKVAVISVSFVDVGYRMSVLSISGWSGFSVVAVIAVMSKSCRHAGQLGGVEVGFISGRSEWFWLVLLDGSLRPAAEAALPWR